MLAPYARVKGDGIGPGCGAGGPSGLEVVDVVVGVAVGCCGGLSTDEVGAGVAACPGAA